MSNKNLVPVYLDQETGELVADFGFIGNTVKAARYAIPNAKIYGEGLVERGKQLVRKAYRATGQKAYGNTKRVIKKAGLALTRGDEGYGRRALGGYLTKNAENIVDAGIATGAVGAGGLTAKMIADRRKKAKDAKNRRYGGLGRYVG